MVANVESLTVTSPVRPQIEESRVRRAGEAPSSRPRLNESARARETMCARGERPVLLADWTDVLFVHFPVDPDALRPHVPFELDLFEGRAYVSVVAFTQRDLRPQVGGRLAARLCRPLATHEFLNVRTYVRHNGERGIYFLAEWIPNRLAALIGPRLYGLPYRLARMRYGAGNTAGEVRTTAGAVAWRARARAETPRPAASGLDRFLLERYTAYTRYGTTALRFRVWHEPWLSVSATVTLREATLLDVTFPWLRGARPLLAHHSGGVRNVWIGPPRRMNRFGGQSKNVGLLACAAVAGRLSPSKNARPEPRRRLIETTKGVV